MQASDEILAIIGKKLSSRASDEELTKLERWIESDVLNRKEYDDLVSIWRDSSRILGEPAFNSTPPALKINSKITAPASSTSNPPAIIRSFRVFKLTGT